MTTATTLASRRRWISLDFRAPFAASAKMGRYVENLATAARPRNHVRNETADL